MTDRYLPNADFLLMLINDEIVIDESEFGQSNLKLLIEFTTDDNPANRDWATLLLSQTEVSSPAVIHALQVAANDEHYDTRCEAILGLAKRKPNIAKPLILRELGKPSVGQLIFEASGLVADPDFIELLECFLEPSGDEFLDREVQEALDACLVESAKRAD